MIHKSFNLIELRNGQFLHSIQTIDVASMIPQRPQIQSKLAGLNVSELRFVQTENGVEWGRHWVTCDDSFLDNT